MQQKVCLKHGKCLVVWNISRIFAENLKTNEKKHHYHHSPAMHVDPYDKSDLQDGSL
jgi:hypothetical protein